MASRLKVGIVKERKQRGEAMRRKDREITEDSRIIETIENCKCCRLGFNDNGEVYIVPMNFGYIKKEDKLTLYFHSAKEGRKISLIKSMDRVGFEMDTGYELTIGKSPCEYSAKFQSIIGNGNVSIVEGEEEKKFALQRIMYQNTKEEMWEFEEKMIHAVCVFKVEVTKLSCKAHE